MAMNAQDVVQIFSVLEQRLESKARRDPFVQIYFYFQPRRCGVQEQLNQSPNKFIIAKQMVSGLDC